MNNNSSRRRKNPKSPQRHVTFEDGVIEKDKSTFTPRQFFTQHSRKLIVLILFTGIVYLLFAPPPKFSQEVQFWHDSSYLYKFGQFDIHFHDIPRIKKPVSLNPVLLILHGFPTSSYDWRDLVPKFHKKFGRVIIPDFLGFGFSDKPKKHVYSIMEQAEMVESLLKYLNITEVHMLSHDYGDTVLQELLARSDDPSYNLKFKIKSICLSNGGIIPSQHKPLLIQSLLVKPILRSILPYLTTRFIFASRFSSVFAPDRTPSSRLLDDFYAIISYKGGNLVSPAILRYIAERHENEERWVGALQETKIPIHLIYGPLDPINTPDGFLKTYKELVPHSTVSVLEGIGHYPQLEAPTGFVKAYEKFLKQINI